MGWDRCGPVPIHAPTPLVGISEAFRQHLDAGQNHHERILDLVGHSGGHPAKRVELLRLDQLQLRDPELGLVLPNLAEPAGAQRNRDVRGDNKQDDKRAAERHFEVHGREIKDRDGDEADAKEDRHDGPAPVVRQQERRDEGKASGQNLLVQQGLRPEDSRADGRRHRDER